MSNKKKRKAENKKLLRRKEHLLKQLQALNKEEDDLDLKIYKMAMVAKPEDRPEIKKYIETLNLRNGAKILDSLDKFWDLNANEQYVAKNIANIMEKMPPRDRSSVINEIHKELEKSKSPTYSIDINLDKLKKLEEEYDGKFNILHHAKYIKNSIHFEIFMHNLFGPKAILMKKDIKEFIKFAMKTYNVDILEVGPLFLQAINTNKKYKKLKGSTALAILFQSIRDMLDMHGDEVLGFQDFFNHDKTIKLFNNINIDDEEQSIGEIMKYGLIATCYHTANFEKFGKKAYEVSNSLAVSLANTEIRGVRAEDVNLPYKSIYISIPKNLAITLPYEKDESVVGSIIKGAYITEYEHDGVKNWNTLFTTEHSYTSSLVSNYTSFISLEDGSKIEDCIKNVEDICIDKVHDPAVFRWLINVIIYATWADADIEHIELNSEAKKLWSRIKKLPSGSRKKGNLQRKYDEIDKKRRIILGNKITINRHKVDYITDDESEEGKKLEVRTLVQGHWRHCWVGKGRRYRERKWIKPFWRGPKDGPISDPLRKLRCSGVELPY